MTVLIKGKLTRDEDEVSFFLPVEAVGVYPEALAAAESADVTLNVTEKNQPEVTEMLMQELTETEEPASGSLAEDGDAMLAHQEELDALKEKIKEESYRIGYEEALHEVKSQYEADLASLASVTTALNDAIPNYLKESEAIIASIVFAAVSKIIGDELVYEAKSIQVVEQIIRSLDQEAIREVLVSQSDFDAIEKLKQNSFEDSSAEAPALNTLAFKADSTIAFGGCRVKLLDGYLNATLESQLKMLAESLNEKVESFEGAQ